MASPLPSVPFDSPVWNMLRGIEDRAFRAGFAHGYHRHHVGRREFVHYYVSAAYIHLDEWWIGYRAGRRIADAK